jgi:hypothetical protein
MTKTSGRTGGSRHVERRVGVPQRDALPVLEQRTKEVIG